MVTSSHDCRRVHSLGFLSFPGKTQIMAPSGELFCSECEAETSHRLVARTKLHLGVKRKWRCEDCEHRVVTINNSVPTTTG